MDDFIQKPFDPLDLLGRVEYIFRRQKYISNSSNGVMAPEEERKKVESLINATPDEVAKVFIEAWNTQDFASEYDCLASEMLGNIVKKDYITRRKQCYLDTKGEQTTQNCLEISNSTQHHNMATVTCLREDIIRGVPRKRKDEYILRKTDSGWKIINVRPA